jgi:putative ABC transport system substrate-binding protein
LLGAAGWPALLSAAAQPATKVARVGFVSPLAGKPEPPTLLAFRQGLQELGYVEGRNLVIEPRFAEGRSDRFPELIGELIALNVDVLLVGSEVGAQAARKATSTLPIVFAGVSDPVAGGLVESLARPGGNITGATFGVGGVGFGAKWIELLREAVPSASDFAVLTNLADPQSKQLLGDLDVAARKLNLRLRRFDAADESGLDKAFAAIAASGAHAMILTAAPFFANSRAKIVAFAERSRLPAIYFFSLFTDAGGLMSYGGSVQESYRRAASHVDKVLKGAKPAELPITQPIEIELVVNRRAARALGIVLPQSLLLRADRVID